MQVFLLFSIPLFLGHLIYSRREQIKDFIPVRKRVIRGMLGAVLPLVIVLLLRLFTDYRITPLSLYLYSFLLYFLIPTIFSLLTVLRSKADFEREGERGLMLMQSQLSGFFILYNLGMYFIFITSLDQINLLFIPLYHLLYVHTVSRAIWRSPRFEKAWQFLMYSSLIILFILAPGVQMLYGLIRPFWAWILAAGILSVLTATDRFYSRLEGDIQYRLSLESRIKPIMRLFYRPGS